MSEGVRSGVAGPPAGAKSAPQTAPTPHLNSHLKAARHLYDLYRSDRLVVHSIPDSLLHARPSHLADPTTMLSSSICFHQGIHNQPSGRAIPNAVARFGKDAHATNFGTLHDLSLIWQVHEALEAGKAPEAQGRPFVFFTNCDMCDLANECGGQPCKVYPDTVYQYSAPVNLQRTRSFDFRGHCEAAAVKDDPRKDQQEWNELRAVLSADSLVGLLYIADPGHDPRSHVGPLEALHQGVLQQLGKELPVGVFALHEAGGISGELLVVEGEGEDAGGAGGQGGGRLLLFEEWLADIRDKLSG